MSRDERRPAAVMASGPVPATVTPAPSTATAAPSIRPTSVPPGRPSPRLSATSPGSPGISGWLAGKDWTYIPTTRRVVALTFDAGANADAVPSILATLRREGVPATFFPSGTSPPRPGRSPRRACGSAITPSPTSTSPSSATPRCSARLPAGRSRSSPSPARTRRRCSASPTATPTPAPSPSRTGPATYRSGGPWTPSAGREPPGTSARPWWPPGCWPRPGPARSS